MLRIKGKWVCKECLHESKTAHLLALADYSLLINEYITNQQARNFLQIESRHVVRNLLLKEKLKTFGSQKGLNYYLDAEYLLEAFESEREQSKKRENVIV